MYYNPILVFLLWKKAVLSYCIWTFVGCPDTEAAVSFVVKDTGKTQWNGIY